MDVLTEDDHARGCPGREYECTCGYDARLADEIARLRLRVWCELAKIVADVLSQHGLDVRGPEDGDLDEVEKARWAVCQEIVRALQQARADDRADRMEDALHRIVWWSEAYPLTVNRLSAAALRHVVEGLGKIAHEGLNPSRSLGQNR
jgi:hypothetical protein